MVALLHHVAAIDDDDGMGFADGRQAVRDNDCGAPLHQRVERALDQFFRFIVER